MREFKQLLKPVLSGSDEVCTKEDILNATPETINELVAIYLQGWRWVDIGECWVLTNQNLQHGVLDVNSTSKIIADHCPSWVTKLSLADDLTRKYWFWSEEILKTDDQTWLLTVSSLHTVYSAKHGDFFTVTSSLTHPPTDSDRALARCKSALLVAIKYGHRRPSNGPTQRKTKRTD